MEKPIIEWIRQIGTSDRDEPQAIATDSQDNIFVVGYTEWEIKEEHRISRDAFITKFDTRGNEKWTKYIGTANEDKAQSIIIDSEGNVFMAGFTAGQIGEDKSKGSRDAFLIKFDINGEQSWTKQIGTAAWDVARDIAVDAQGNILMTGFTGGQMGEELIGKGDAFVIKFDKSGNELWTKQIGTESYDEANAITTDTQGNVFVAGFTQGQIGEQHKGEDDAFITKLDTNGELLWTKQMGTESYDYAQAVATDSQGNVFMAGYTHGKIRDEEHQGGGDVFITKFDTSGSELWTKQIGTVNRDSANAMTTDAQDNILIAGTTTGQMGEKSEGGSDTFIAKFSTSGEQLWIKQIGTDSKDGANALAIDSQGNIFMAGRTSGQIGAEQKGDVDAFIAKFSTHASTPDWMNNLDRELIAAAEARTQGKRDGRISGADAQALIKLATNGEGDGVKKKKTLAFIHTHYNLTGKARRVMLAALKTA